LAIVEDRIRVARDLHDGVLQSLTGIRFELQDIAMAEQDAATPTPVADRLLAIERALSIEQRELRRFIEGLKPGAGAAGDTSFAAHLEELRARLSVEWKTPITLRVHPADALLPRAAQEEIVLMAQEAAVNALKHGQPSRVTIDITLAGDRLNLVATDDGRGFPFAAGRYDQTQLAALKMGPVSLRERVNALGGSLVLESSTRGTRVEIAVPLGAVHV
jgi:signal transduction histidine kinase